MHSLKLAYFSVQGDGSPEYIYIKSCLPQNILIPLLLSCFFYENVYSSCFALNTGRKCIPVVFPSSQTQGC